MIGQYGRVDFLVNNAPPPFLGIDRCDYQQFVQALKVGVVAPYYLTRLLAPHFGEGASVVNISSTRQFMSQPYSESYSAAKGGIGALTHALAASLAGKAPGERHIPRLDRYPRPRLYRPRRRPASAGRWAGPRISPPW